MKKIALILAIIVLLSSLQVVAFAEDLYTEYESKSVTSMRMEPLVKKYQALTDAEVLAWEKSFDDIANHYAKTYIAKLAALELISGYGNGKFGPNDTLLAGQYIKMVVNTLGFTPEIPNKARYWEPFVEIALSEGLIKEGEIKDYTAPISRELAGVIGIRALFKYKEYPSEDNVWFDYNRAKIKDYAYISDEYKNDVVMCCRMGILQGNGNGIFEPKGTLTRGQAAIIMVRLLDDNLRVESVPADDEIIVYKFREDVNEYLFDYGFKAGQERIIYPGFFPMDEIYDVFKALYSNLNVGGGHKELIFSSLKSNFSVLQFVDKSRADHFYMVDNRYPTEYASFIVHLKNCYEEGKLSSIGDGYLYSIGVFDFNNYNKQMKPYIHEVFKTLFGDDTAEAIRIHDYYLDIALNNKPYEKGVYFLNDRRVYIFASGGGFGVQIYAKGAF